jgi:hypothetical protein
MKCPNCGAEIPTGDLFCGECGARVGQEEKPASPPPSITLPPAEKPKQGLPKGLLIGCGGLLALFIVAACIFGIVALMNPKEPTPTPTLTPTQIVQRPTSTPTSPLAASATEVAPVFKLVAFAQDVTDDDEPVEPGTTFPADTIQVYAIFDYSGMKDGLMYDAYWYRDGQEELHKSWEWSLGETGTSWVNIFNDDGLTPGNYELEVYVGDRLLLNGKFIIQTGFAATVSNVRFARDKADDDSPVGVSDVFPYGVTQVYVFFDYTGFGGVTEIESTWLRDGQTDASGALDWTGNESGSYRIRFYDDKPLIAGDYEWQMHIVGTQLASSSFRIEEPLFADDFSDPESGWSETSDDESAQGYRDGAYFINVFTPDLAVWSTPGYTFDDFTLQVEAQQTTGDEANEYGLLFRYIDNANFYSFDVTGKGTFALFKLENKEWSTLVNWQTSTYLNPLGELNRLKVVCQGNQITLYANDYELISVTDGSFARGDVGLFAGTFDEPEVEAVFDNLVVTENR